jgi:hypothetical protein
MRDDGVWPGNRAGAGGSNASPPGFQEFVE